MNDESEITARSKALLGALGIATSQEVISVEPLTGGVASDIAVVDLGSRKLCVKFALPKLKVAADWHAPVHRNAAEYAWLKVAAEIAPESAVELLGRSEEQHGFVMEYLDGTDVYLWKTRLLEGTPDDDEAISVGSLLGRIHAASARHEFDRSAFHNSNDFHALRIEPYLSATASAHPELASAIAPLEKLLFGSTNVLVHGDASPKNILFRGKNPIILDAECATMGDACFDPAFCLNHLILKAVHLQKCRTTLLQSVGQFWQAYAVHVTWEDAGELEAKICRLLPILMLARVDGKSPVEYLSQKDQDVVRRLAIPLITNPVSHLDKLIARLSQQLNEGDQ